ncbi:MAG: VOC family protein [Rhodobacteraceae bacterium]|jgi:PhnB protein|nr:VOC family protein [Paracoccaceae bacterium]
MPLSPYLHFDGTCTEALAFYAEVFGDPAPDIRTFGEMPDLPADWDKTRVLHGAVKIAGGVLMASDSPTGMPTEPQAGMSISAALPDDATARAAFDRLAEGGAVIMPYEKTFFSTGFGMLKDRFGTHWMISIDEAMPA